jgi:hypothetical protein
MTTSRLPALSPKARAMRTSTSLPVPFSPRIRVGRSRGASLSTAWQTCSVSGPTAIKPAMGQVKLAAASGRFSSPSNRTGAAISSSKARISGSIGFS